MSRPSMRPKAASRTLCCFSPMIKVWATGNGQISGASWSCSPRFLRLSSLRVCLHRSFSLTDQMLGGSFPIHNGVTPMPVAQAECDDHHHREHPCSSFLFPSQSPHADWWRRGPWPPTGSSTPQSAARHARSSSPAAISTTVAIHYFWFICFSTNLFYPPGPPISKARLFFVFFL